MHKCTDPYVLFITYVIAKQYWTALPALLIRILLRSIDCVVTALTGSSDSLRHHSLVAGNSHVPLCK